MAYHNSFFGAKVCKLPNQGILLFATDLHGNYQDYKQLKQIYLQEKVLGNQPFLLFCGDLVHGPSADLLEPNAWLDHLGDPYYDQSAELIIDFMDFSKKEQTVSLLGNHEHAHIGGPMLSKFHPDEAKELAKRFEQAGGSGLKEFFQSFPLIAISRNGVSFSHAAPAATEETLTEFENLRYEGYKEISTWDMYEQGTIGALLWARMASEEQAKRFLKVTSPEIDSSFVAFGHDIIDEGYDRIDQHQICVSTSFGLFNRFKTYLRLDLSEQCQGTSSLIEQVNICALYPNE